jgi:predicted HTH transcriptional regulator
MALIDKPLELITEQDLLDLISNQVREDKRIEFKVVLPSNSDKDKKEFLADVSSFANASGGDLIFGIEAQNGIPSKLVGLPPLSLDGDILRLENILRDGLDPRIPNVKFWPIKLMSRMALVIRVPRSWMPPHRVKYGGSSRFYARNSAGKYELEVSEMRPLFALTTSAVEQIRNFRVERLSKITSGELTVPLKRATSIGSSRGPFQRFRSIESI